MDVNATYDKPGWVRAYLDIWRGILELTEREMDLTVLIALRYLELSEGVTSPALLAELLLSPTAKQHIRRELAAEDGTPMSANNLQNYLSSLKDKEVLVPYQDKYLLAELLIPQKTITFNFSVTE